MDQFSSAELARWLTRVEAKLDKVTEDHERRLRRVERVVWSAAGVAMAGGLAGSGSLLAVLSGG